MAGSGKVACFNLFDEAGAGLRDDFDPLRVALDQVRHALAGERRAGGQDANHSAARGVGRRLDGGLRPDDRHGGEVAAELDPRRE